MVVSIRSLGLNGIAGYDQVKSTFTLLGVLMLVAGGALTGYGFLLRSRGTTDPGE